MQPQVQAYYYTKIVYSLNICLLNCHFLYILENRTYKVNYYKILNFLSVAMEFNITINVTQPLD